MPRWLVLTLLGIGLGAGGVLYLQERVLPPRLSGDASAELRESFERADAERQRLQAELTATSERLRRALDENKRLASEAGARATTVQHLREDIASLVASLPPDPRNAPVAVRAARFEVQGGALAYNVVLSRERAGPNPFGGVMQLVVAGPSGRAADAVALAAGAGLGRALRRGARQSAAAARLQAAPDDDPGPRQGRRQGHGLARHQRQLTPPSGQSATTIDGVGAPAAPRFTPGPRR